MGGMGTMEVRVCLSVTSLHVVASRYASRQKRDRLIAAARALHLFFDLISFLI